MEAIPHYEAAARLSPDSEEGVMAKVSNFDANHHQKWISFRCKSTAAAMLFEQGLKVDPNSWIAHFYLGETGLLPTPTSLISRMGRL